MDAYEDIDFNNPNSPTIQQKILAIKAKYCEGSNTTLTGWCPEVWDAILCWPSTAPGVLAVQACPIYIAGFDNEANATRQCMADGQWFWNNETNTAWSNYSQCYSDSFVTLLVEVPDAQEYNVTFIKDYVPIVKTISRLGYTVSFLTLLVAFCILAAIKKLRCSRNMLHMHLFASFMMRAFMALLKDFLFVSGIGLASDVLMKNGNNYWLDKEMETSWLCKALTSFWQYFIMANYFWILMEGLYLHNLVFLALFRDANSSIAVYVGLGWGLPAAVVVCWAVARIILEDRYCWTTHDNPYLFLIIRVPIMLSILTNFILFINIVRVLLSKLESTVTEESQRYKRWAKSTLVLVPLFGVHYTLFLGMTYSIGVNETVEVAWLFCDQLFASFQGCFVAILYCFLNGEVRAELKTRAINWPDWSRFRFRFGLGLASSRASSTCSCNANRCHSKHNRRILSRQSPIATCWRATCHCFVEKRAASPRYAHSMASTQDIPITGTSLASSRGFLEAGGNETCALHTHNIHQDQEEHCLAQDKRSRLLNTACLSSNYAHHSLQSFCSNVSDVSRTSESGESMQKLSREEMMLQRWSDTESSQLALEMQRLQGSSTQPTSTMLASDQILCSKQIN